MSPSDKFLEVVKGRRSIYTLSKETTIPDSKIEEIVKFAVTWAPSSYNVQSARAVVLLGAEHDKLWATVKKHMDQVPMDEGVKGYLAGRINGFSSSYGTVMWFEDQAALDALGEKNPMVVPLLTEFSDHSSGMHQFIAWAALEAEGLGASLQHFNFHPGIVADVKSTWGLPETWKLKSQLVFGKPTGHPQDKTFEPIEKRVFVKA
ncbi:putative nitroreductase [Exophiala xenobiotica]|nr:putative nitroreductase [Exophiala xenobiotica]